MRTTTLLTFLGASLFAAVNAPSAHGQALKATLVTGGFTQPIFLCSPPGDTQRLFVVEQGGRIRIVQNGAILATPFLNVGAAAGGGLGLISTGSERGLLGLAFHPNYAANGHFYINYTAVTTGATVVRRYTVSANPDIANTASGLTILGPIAQPQTNHNGGGLQFGPDGKLYIGMGDGGASNDTGTGHATGGNSQSPSTLLGKMLRIDVDLPPPYIPADNPYFGSGTTLQEIWHFGVRNPWRFSFDRANGNMFIGDVGQNAWEEISVQPAGVGNLNFGWRCMEGNNCSGLTGCTCNSPTLTPAIHQYGHGLGCSVTGGYVYRGCAIPGLQGTYFFADYCSSSIWSFTYNGAVVANFTDRTNELEPAGAPTIGAVSSFGEDASGELYICDYGDGEIYRIDPVSGFADCNLNGVNDACDIASGASLDVNTNAVPDECECIGGTPPVVYCTAKLNSLFCLPAIAYTGLPKATTNTPPFVISASNIVNNKSGLLFYGYLSHAAPFQGGFMCVKSPLRRTGVQNSGGLPSGSSCTGVLSYDFGARILSGADPLLVAGQQVNTQFWSRDPADPFTTNTTNALQFQICQ